MRQAAATLAFVCAFLLACLGLSAFAAQDDKPGAGKRVALVIGNSQYSHVQTLANPVNDADAMEAALKAKGFVTFVGKDLDRTAFQALIEKVRREAQDADSVLVHFSGHGFQMNGRNFLVPVDAKLGSVEDIPLETIRLDNLIGALQSPDRQLLVFLDACRNDPLPPSRRDAGKAPSEGLAQVSTGNGVFVAFATQPGNISYDGRSKLSPFTKAVAKRLNRPDASPLSVSDLLIDVRNDVERATLHQQTPWDQSSLKKQFYFRPEALGISPVLAGTPATPAGVDVATAGRSTAVEPAATRPVVPISPDVTRPQVITIPKLPSEIFADDEIVSAMQTALKRIGCYRGDVDGAWGRGSRKALTSYYKTRKLQPTDTEPTRFHLANLQREEGTVCVYKPPAVAKPRIRRASPRRTTPRRATKRRAARPAKRAGTKARRSAKRGSRSAAKPRRSAPRRAAAPKKKRRSLAGVSATGGLR